MSERTSMVVVGCNSCKQKARALGQVNDLNNQKRFFQPFPTETAYLQGHHIELILGYSCPFCGKELQPTPLMMQMFDRFMKGPSHVVIRQKDAEIFGDGAHAFIPLDEPISSVEDYLKQKGVHIEGIDPYLFENPKEDIRILQEAARNYDRNQWIILIQSAHNPEPYLKDDAAWFNLFGEI